MEQQDHQKVKCSIFKCIFSQFCRTLFNTCDAMVSQYFITVRQLAVSAFCHLSHAVSAFCHLSHAVSTFCHLSHGNECILSMSHSQGLREFSIQVLSTYLKKLDTFRKEFPTGFEPAIVRFISLYSTTELSRLG